MPVEWLRFLNTVWIDDQQTIDTLQELCGLFLTPNTAHQKLFLMIGPRRSGKGTIARVLTALLGRANVVNPTLASLATNFGLAPLINKPLAVIGDARLGKSTDPASVAERLLSISGEDGQTIDRKFLGAWVGTLPTRFLIISNELPRLTDASGALAGRFIVLPMTTSFYGREDQGLLNRLLPELPGILNWALAGLDRLNARGHFVQPRAAQEAIEALEDLASPVGAFIRQRCVVEAKHTVGCDELYAAWQHWCAGHGRHAGTTQLFSRDLKAVMPEVTTERPRTGAERQRVYRGVGLLADAPSGSGAPLF